LVGRGEKFKTKTKKVTTNTLLGCTHRERLCFHSGQQTITKLKNKELGSEKKKHKLLSPVCDTRQNKNVGVGVCDEGRMCRWKGVRRKCICLRML
jgi:hypothetical protein